MTAAACGDDDDDASSSAEAAATSAAAEVSSAVDSAPARRRSVAEEASSAVDSAMSEADSATEAASGGGGRRRRRSPPTSAASPARSPSTARPRSSPSRPPSPRSSPRRPAASRSRSARPAPAAASRSSATARPTSPTPRARSRTTRRPRASDKGVEFIELEIAKDALTVAVNIDNDWATCLTTEQLKTIWNEGSTVAKWNEVSPDFPDEDLVLYGPDTDSGTFDYFTAEINGEEGVSRSDYTASADDNVLVQGVSGDKGGLGYFGFAYYEENQDTLKALEVDSGGGCVAPSADTVLDGTYTPLSRPLFIYVSKASAARPEVAAFVNYYLANGASLVEEVGYVPEPAEKYSEDCATFATFAGS